MYLAYYDEAGDDGFPLFSSPLFVLSSIYLHYLNWRQTFDAIVNFRRAIKEQYGVPVRMEMHTRSFLLSKKPYSVLRLAEDKRLEIVGLFCDLIAGLNIKVLNVVIVKPRIKRNDYKILDTAVTYSVQRIENDLNPKRDAAQRFMMITDTGRVGKMTQTTRRIQRINFIPSKYGPAYRQEISTLIEDPLPKNSDQSYFIQMADLVSYVVYLYSLNIVLGENYPKRMGHFVSPETVMNWMERLKPSFNLLASRQDPYGIVYYPK